MTRVVRSGVRPLVWPLVKPLDGYVYYACLTVALFLAANPVFSAAKPDHSPKRIAEIVDALKKQLGISNEIEVKIEANNRLAVSVEPIKQSGGGFAISMDDAFLDRLDEDEMDAAVAHELGHVWIFTHHPFLQTEALANQWAMRVVSRESLKKLYLKLWEFEGSTGKIDDLLGPDPI